MFLPTLCERRNHARYLFSIWSIFRKGLTILFCNNYNIFRSKNFGATLDNLRRWTFKTSKVRPFNITDVFSEETMSDAKTVQMSQSVGFNVVCIVWSNTVGYFIRRISAVCFTFVTESDIKRIIKQWKHWIEKLVEPRGYVLSRMLAEKVIECQQYTTIIAIPSREDRIRAVLEHIVKPEHSMPSRSFLNALTQDHPGLADNIRRQLASKDETFGAQKPLSQPITNQPTDLSFAPHLSEQLRKITMAEPTCQPKFEEGNFILTHTFLMLQEYLIPNLTEICIISAIFLLQRNKSSILYLLINGRERMPYSVLVVIVIPSTIDCSAIVVLIPLQNFTITTLYYYNTLSLQRLTIRT